MKVFPVTVKWVIKPVMIYLPSSLSCSSRVAMGGTSSLLQLLYNDLSALFVSSSRTRISLRANRAARWLILNPNPLILLKRAQVWIFASTKTLIIICVVLADASLHMLCARRFYRQHNHHSPIHSPLLTLQWMWEHAVYLNCSVFFFLAAYPTSPPKLERRTPSERFDKPSMCGRPSPRSPSRWDVQIYTWVIQVESWNICSAQSQQSPRGTKYCKGRTQKKLVSLFVFLWRNLLWAERLHRTDPLHSI